VVDTVYGLRTLGKLRQVRSPLGQGDVQKLLAGTKGGTVKIEMVNCEATLLRDIAEPISTRKYVAETYGLTLRSSEFPTIDWAKINRAIIKRWSMSALTWIKREAWRNP